MQTTHFDDFKTGHFIRELKNRFLCEVEIDSESVVCYVPSSCHLSNFLRLYKKEVLLVPTTTPNSRTKYALFAVPYKRSYIVLNTSMANRAVDVSLQKRLFAFLGKRNSISKEHFIDGYKCDFYIEDSDTIIEIKSIIATEYEAAFPTVYSERTVNQLRKIQELLKAGRRACFLVVSLHPYLRKIVIARDTDFHKELKICMANGMVIRAYTSRLTERGLIIEHQIPIEIL